MIAPGWWDDLKLEHFNFKTKDCRFVNKLKWVKPLKVLSNSTYRCAADTVVSGEINETC